MAPRCALQPIRVIELFAGVGGFRLGLEGYPHAKNSDSTGRFRVVWANQWEPPGSEARQFAYRCYLEHFGEHAGNRIPPQNESIEVVNRGIATGEYLLPKYDMLVGGFPCQDYSVAKPLSQADGIDGKKGVLWWQIYERLQKDTPRYVLLENVDRLLKSPALRRGHDFAVILACLAQLGYVVEWRVINAAEYGFPQRRRRVFIFAERLTVRQAGRLHMPDRLLNSGVLARAFPVVERQRFLEDAAAVRTHYFSLHHDLALVDDPDFPFFVSQEHGSSGHTGSFMSAGLMISGQGIQLAASSVLDDVEVASIGEVVRKTRQIPDEFFIDEEKLAQWRYLKGSKKVRRTSKSGFEYDYSEGSMTFPEDLRRPSRTILTGEGGTGPSRFKHVVEHEDGRLRRLIPEELEELNGFPRGWTDTGMTDAQRAFCMGNALVVGVVRRIGTALGEILQ